VVYAPVAIDTAAAPGEGDIAYMLPFELVMLDGVLGGTLNNTSQVVKKFTLDYTSPLAQVILESESGDDECILAIRIDKTEGK